MGIKTIVKKTLGYIYRKYARKIYVKYYKDSIKYVTKYSECYNQEVSIKYLDNVLDEFFGMLEGYAEEGREIPERVFTNFILNNLDSEYNPN